MGKQIKHVEVRDDELAGRELKREKVTDDQPRVQFDCNKCPAFCCSIYERVAIGKRDLNRLAKYFGVTHEVAARRYTKIHRESGERVLRRANDPLLGESCKFLDKKTRGCGIYHARPTVCREYPNRTRCSYYDVYRFESKQQNDARVLPLFKITFVEPPEVEQVGGESVWEWTPERK